MAHITVRFIQGNGFISRAIAWVTNSYWSHTELGTPEGTWIGAHAGSGVQERPADYCNPRLDYVYDIPCTQLQSDAVLRYARNAIGCRYNYLDILGLLIHHRKLTTPSRVICSQFVMDCLMTAGIRPLNCLSQYSHLITPQTLHLSPMLIGHKRK